MNLIRKAQVLFDEDQYQALEEVARKQKKGIGPLIREVVEMELLHARRREKRLEAAKGLFSLNLPTGDWKETKRSIIHGRFK